MARKYLNQKEGEQKDVSADDEWAHLTGTEEDSEKQNKSKLEVKDAFDVQDRSITFGDEEQKTKTRYQIVKEEARNAMDAAGNTGQYIKFVKNHIDNQTREIDKIKKIKDRFDDQIKLLQSHKLDISKLEKDSVENHDVKKVTNYLQQLLNEKDTTKKKLDTLKNEITGVEDELDEQESQIKNVNEKIIKEDNTKKELKSELSTLIKKHGAQNLSEILDSLKLDKNSKD